MRAKIVNVNEKTRKVSDNVSDEKTSRSPLGHGTEGLGFRLGLAGKGLVAIPGVNRGKPVDPGSPAKRPLKQRHVGL